MSAARRARTRVTAVLGWPIDHSRSPAMHNAAFAASGFDAVMIAIAVPPVGFAAALAALGTVGFLGASVTVPHKEAAAACCAELTPLAARIGAVNCVRFADGRALGDNTDAGGFVDAVEAELPQLAGLAGRRVVLLGAGGAARAVAAGLLDAGAAVSVVARAPDRVRWIAARPWAELAGSLVDCELLVDCTSIGLAAASDDAAWATAPVPLDLLAADAAVATLVYHREPRLLAAARARGLAILDGRAMLAHQGARAFTAWTGLAAPVAVMRAAI